MRLPASETVAQGACTRSARMRPASGPSTPMCFCPATLVAAIFQPYGGWAVKRSSPACTL